MREYGQRQQREEVQKRTYTAQNILSEARYRIHRRMSGYLRARHACFHNKWDNYPQALEYASFYSMMLTLEVYQSRSHKHCAQCR